MSNRPTLQVSKTDAAKRQIETAIRLWFSSGDPVSIHTLTAAALQVIHDLGKRRGVTATLRELPGIRPEYRKQVQELMVRYENFFKHADRDPEAQLSFNPEATQLYLFDAVLTYERLTQDVSPVLATFKAWMLIQHRELLNESAGEELLNLLNSCDTNFRQMPKAQFFSKFQSLLTPLGVC